MDRFKPGQTIRCTILRDINNDDARSTVMRLMRQDPHAKRALKRAQEYRMRTLIVRSRGKRPWEVRQHSAKFVNPNTGSSWTMTYVPHLVNDMASVASYLKIEAA